MDIRGVVDRSGASEIMTQTVQIQVQRCQADNIAEDQLDKAVHNGRAVVSDPCVIRELLLLTRERGITVKFYAMGDNGKVPLDVDGVKRVLEGGEV